MARGDYTHYPLTAASNEGPIHYQDLTCSSHMELLIKVMRLSFNQPVSGSLEHCQNVVERSVGINGKNTTQIRSEWYGNPETPEEDMAHFDHDVWKI